MTRGKFIVFEGGEGSGKTTVIERLKKEMPDLVAAKDPGGTPLGEQIRELLMSERTQGIDPRAELLLFLAARAELIEKVIRPALEGGKSVICSRFTLSSIAYQGYGRERLLLLPLVREISERISDGIVPDATILLDVTPEKGIERVHARPEEPSRFDKENIEFHTRVREGFKNHVNEFGKSFIIDADKPLEEMWTDVLAAVQSIL